MLVHKHTNTYSLRNGSGMHCALEFNYNPKWISKKEMEKREEKAADPPEND